MFVVKKKKIFANPTKKSKNLQRTNWAVSLWNPKTFETPKQINESFHESIGSVLIFGQIFSLIPVSGVLGDIEKVHFTWYSLRTFFSALLILVGLFESILAIRHSFRQDFDISSTGSLIFYSVCVSGAIILFLLARKWSTIMRYWRRYESNILREPYTIKGISLKNKIQLISFTILSLSLIEHSLYLGSTLHFNHNQIVLCDTSGKTNLLQYFIIKSHPHIYTIVPYHWSFAIPTQWANTSLTMCWNFVDVVVIIISIGLAVRFEQINQRISYFYKKSTPDSFWLEIRLHYVQILDLVSEIDQDFSWIILLSCGNNLYFICFQLFNIFNELPDIYKKIYVWYSLIYLIGRTLCVFFCAASVNDAAKKPISILRDLPTKSWNNEIQRLLDVVSGECIALSGRKFFYITRRLILAMAGTVVTYELVLQDEVAPDPEKHDLCNITKFDFAEDI